MKEAYLVQHYYQSNKDLDYEKIKELGIYSDKKRAEEAIERFLKLPGFKDHLEFFHIDRLVINENHWREGFIEVDW